MENVELEIKSNELLGMLSSYYSNKLNKKIEVKEHHSIEYEGIYENEVVDVKIYYEEEIEILGHKAKKTTIISPDEIMSIMRELINEDYDVNSIYFQTDISDSDYCQRKSPIFHGVKLILSEKQKKLQKKMMDHENV